MREFEYGVGVIGPNFLLNLLLFKMSEKSSTKADFRGKKKNKKMCPTTIRIGPRKRKNFEPDALKLTVPCR